MFAYPPRCFLKYRFTTVMFTYLFSFKISSFNRRVMLNKLKVRSERNCFSRLLSLRKLEPPGWIRSTAYSSSYSTRYSIISNNFHQLSVIKWIINSFIAVNRFSNGFTCSLPFHCKKDPSLSFDSFRNCLRHSCLINDCYMSAFAVPVLTCMEKCS